MILLHFVNFVTFCVIMYILVFPIKDFFCLIFLIIMVIHLPVLPVCKCVQSISLPQAALQLLAVTLGGAITAVLPCAKKLIYMQRPVTSIAE